MTAPINIVSLAGNVPALSLDVPGIAHQPKANSQRPPGSYAERPLGQTAGVLRFHSSLEGLTDKGAFCSGNYSEQFYTDTTQSSDLSLPGFGKSRADHSFEAYREFN